MAWLVSYAVLPVRAQDNSQAADPQPNPLGVLDTSKFSGKSPAEPVPEMLNKPLPNDAGAEAGPQPGGGASTPPGASGTSVPAEPAEPAAAMPQPPPSPRPEPPDRSDDGTASIGPAPGAAAPPPFVDSADAQRLRDKARAAIAAGDIAAGRALLDDLAGRRDPEASFLLAQTFDPQRLAEWGVVGIAGDPARADALYRQAAQAGYPGGTRSDPKH